ncbi:tetratricopeptide repeat (TPR)-like superfamily protein [Actinidia rufa]|uniref:peptidylprolyl isomerase n=1 Tax=Actinidia rufa TaxID=165716 RepID=A0A7J0GHF9_9ERIC|nr:tetratricopeptide repeat (TPR)-like superfamily protein [Actinidia rufa]
MVMVVEKASNVSQIEDEDELDEEPGEVIESAPPLKVGEEREINSSGLKKKLLKRGLGWDTPEFDDEVTVHYVGTLLDGTKFDSTRDDDKPFNFKLGYGQVVTGLDQAIITMEKGEIALFTLPPELSYGATGANGVPPNCVIQFEVELISWIKVVDVCKDGGIIKKVMEKGEQTGPPSDLDEVLVKYQVKLDDGAIVATTPEDGVEFHVKDGCFCPALPKALKTMRTGEKVNLVIQPQLRSTKVFSYFKFAADAFGERDSELKNDFPLIPSSSVLNIDLELVSFKPVIDITGDSKVIKKILKEGEGTLSANEGVAVTIRYTAMLDDGTIFEKKGFDEGPLGFITDEEQVIAGLDRAVATMKKREHAILTITSEYGFGNTEIKRDLAVVPPNSTLLYEVEMLDFVKAADYVSEDATFGDDDQKLVKALRVSCWLNGAACSLKLNDFHEAIKLCSKVLDVEFHNAKALYRRAQAYMKTADLHLADLDIKRALEADPQNREVKLIQKNLKQLQAESDKRDAKLYSNMFRMTDSSAATKRLKVEKVEDNKRDEEVMAAEMEKVAVSSAAPPL